MKRVKILIPIIFLLISLILPVLAPLNIINFMFFFFMYVAMAETLNLLFGFTGMLNLGFHGFIGLGGYLAALSITLWGSSFWVGFIISGVICAVLALTTSFLIFKMKGLYFALGTFIAASLFRTWFEFWGYAGGGYGMPILLYVKSDFYYYISLMLAVLSILIVYALVRFPKVRLKLVAIADDEVAAEICGVKVFQIKLFCWIISAFMSGLIGNLYFCSFGYISPSVAFTMQWTIIPLTGVILGGIRSIPGPILGSFIVVLLRQSLVTMFPTYAPLIYGALIIIVLLFFPKGIWGLIERIIVKLRS
jgi:branched-chain amino acid transport system permease protein